MTPGTASSHLPLPRGTPLPASHRCCPVASNDTPYAVDQAKIAPSTAAAATNSLPLSSVRRRPRQPAHPLPKLPPRQIPLDGYRPPAAPRVPSWEAFGRRPSERAPIATTGRHPKPFTNSVVSDPRRVSRKLPFVRRPIRDQTMLARALSPER